MTVVANIPTYQSSRDNNISTGAVPSVAYTETQFLMFRNAATLLKFTVKGSNVKGLIFYGNNDEAVSGNIKVSLNENNTIKTIEAQETTITENEVTETKMLTWAKVWANTANWCFTEGTTYYLAVVPQKFSNGFTAQLEIDGVGTVDVKKLESEYELRPNTIVDLGELEYVEPSVTPGETSEWALVGAFSDWTDQYFVTTSDADIVVLEDVTMEAAQGFLVRKPSTEWADKYGAGSVNYLKANHYITTSKDGADMCLETAGTYDIYFNITTKALYVMAADADYTTATNQTVNGEEPEQEEPEVTENVLYLTPNSNWKGDNARFAAYFFNNGGNAWVSMTDSDSDGIYEVNIPEGYTFGDNVIFCRMNPNTTANNWNNKWNQTADLVIPNDGTNLYTVKDNTWDKGGGAWSTKQ